MFPLTRTRKKTMPKVHKVTEGQLEKEEIRTPRRVGRPSKTQEEKAQYFRQPLSLKEEQWKGLMGLSEALNIRSRSGVHHGEFSWRTLIALLADMAPKVVGLMNAHRRGQEPERMSIGSGFYIVYDPESVESSEEDESKKD